MSRTRQRALRVEDERFLIVRTLCARCAPGVRTTSPTAGWDRLIDAGRGILLVGTPHGRWSAPSGSAVWVGDGVRAEIETVVETELRVFYVRAGRARWSRASRPVGSVAVRLSGLLRETLGRVVEAGSLDRREEEELALGRVLLHEVLRGAAAPLALVWPSDARIARLASMVQGAPGDRRGLREMCRGGGVSERTAQRLFPLETGLTFEEWRSRARVLHAARLLAEGRKVGDVGEECGYRSASAFVSAFTRVMGVTPGRYGKS